MEPEILVRLKILSENMTPEELSFAVKFPSDHSWKKGDIVSGTKMSRKENAWIIVAQCAKCEPLEKQISDLIKRIADHSEQIRILSRTETVEFSCVIYSDHSPELNFSSELIREISGFGASLDVDVILTE